MIVRHAFSHRYYYPNRYKELPDMTSFETLALNLIPGLVSEVVPNGAVLGPVIGSGIADAETLFAGSSTGPQKKAAVVSVAGDAVSLLNAAKGKVVLDPDTTAAQVSDAIDLGISFINDIQQLQGKYAAPSSAPPIPA
jgi:hypothetical protein